ncbi:MAG: cystathionine beta-lyase [Hyphomonadaceae bacterium]|nr:cystathionine beta-lyase [Hyphomonadaceae bacterium]
MRAGRAQGRESGAVNPPIQRGSTVLFPDIEALHGPGKSYGLEGFGIHDALTEALADISGATGAVLAPSGLAAVTTALLSFTRAGGEVLVTDSVYAPTRRFCDGLLTRHGVTTRYFDPRIGAGIEAMISPSTQIIFLESPGSLTLEIQDAPAITRIAKARGIATIIDDTWSAGLHFKPFDHGVDVSVQALTKYQAGHADVLLGATLALDPAHVARLKQTVKELGLGCGAAEDAYLTLRGLRTMPLRIERQSASGLAVAEWLSRRPEVARVLHPALASHPDHALFQRDFTGAAGVFSIVLKPVAKARLAAMLDGLALFGLGFSWGGYESLVINCTEQETRKVARWTEPGALLRFSIGLEDPADLIADLDAGFARLAG